MITLNDEELFLPDFAPIWFTNCEDRYRGLKGARETGKTYNFIGLESIFKLFRIPHLDFFLNPNAHKKYLSFR